MLVSSGMKYYIGLELLKHLAKSFNIPHRADTNLNVNFALIFIV